MVFKIVLFCALIGQAVLANKTVAVDSDSDLAAVSGPTIGDAVGDKMMHIGIVEPAHFGGPDIAIDYVPYVPDPECEYQTPEQQFARASDNGSKSINFTAYYEMVDRCGVSYRRKEFNRIDTNQDGTISPQEWTAEQLQINATIERQNQEYYNNTFVQADTNGDGEVNLKEFKQFLKSWNRDPKNAASYLEEFGGALDLDQFTAFHQNISFETFPYTFNDVYTTYGNYGGFSSEGKPGGKHGGRGGKGGKKHGRKNRNKNKDSANDSNEATDEESNSPNMLVRPAHPPMMTNMVLGDPVPMTTKDIKMDDLVRPAVPAVFAKPVTLSDPLPGSDDVVKTQVMVNKVAPDAADQAAVHSKPMILPQLTREAAAPAS